MSSLRLPLFATPKHFPLLSNRFSPILQCSACAGPHANIKCTSSGRSAETAPFALPYASLLESQLNSANAHLGECRLLCRTLFQEVLLLREKLSAQSPQDYRPVAVSSSSHSVSPMSVDTPAPSSMNLDTSSDPVPLDISPPMSPQQDSVKSPEPVLDSKRYSPPSATAKPVSPAIPSTSSSSSSSSPSLPSVHRPQRQSTSAFAPRSNKQTPVDLEGFTLVKPRRGKNTTIEIPFIGRKTPIPPIAEPMDRYNKLKFLQRFRKGQQIGQYRVLRSRLDKSVPRQIDVVDSLYWNATYRHLPLTMAALRFPIRSTSPPPSS